MTQLLGKIAADFNTQLATKLSVGGTTATLASATDDDGVALPSGRYFFTIDKGNSKKEYISCSLSGTSLTSIKTISRQGTETSGAAREHRVGANVIISDFAHIKKINDLFDGTTSFDSATPLGYDGAPNITTGNQITTKTYVDDSTVGISGDETVAGVKTFSSSPIVPTPTTDYQASTKKYVDDTAVAGAPNASTTVKGIVEEATQAEIIAGTATGATGARLAMNPSTFITALPTLIGGKAISSFPEYAFPTNSISGISLNINTRLNFGLVTIYEAIDVNKITIATGLPTVNGTLKVAMFSADGSTKLFEVTTTTITASGAITTTLSATTTLLAGKYYIAVLPVGTADMTIFTYLPVSNSFSPFDSVSGKVHYSGYKTVTASTMPSTLDPITSVTADQQSCIVCRLDN